MGPPHLELRVPLFYKATSPTSATSFFVTAAQPYRVLLARTVFPVSRVCAEGLKIEREAGLASVGMFLTTLRRILRVRSATH